MSWPYFSAQEMQCRCGCEAAQMASSFMTALHEIRLQYGRPMIVSSAYRCPSHNAQVSTTGTQGPHTTGQAVDVRVYGTYAVELISIALQYGMTGIGVQQKGARAGRFIHMDNLHTSARPWIWSYA